MQLIFKISMDFGLCHATKSHVLPIHRDIIQVVQVTEYTDLSKLGDTG